MADNCMECDKIISHTTYNAFGGLCEECHDEGSDDEFTEGDDAEV